MITDMGSLARRALPGVLLGVCGVLLGASGAAAADVHLGVVTGPNVARLDVQDLDPSVRLSRRTSLAAGAVVAWSPRESLFLELQPMYAGKGASVRTGSEELEVRIRYFDLPLRLKLGTARGRIRPYALGGAWFAFRSGATLNSPIGEEDIEADVEKYDWGVVAGAGVRALAGRAWVFVDAEHQWGLRDINRSTRPFADRTRTRSLQVKLGVTLPLG